ncbi:hypothetical protein ACSVC9_01665 [Clostridium sp. LBM24168]
MNLKNKDLNFALEILCFTAFIIAAYFFINWLEYIAIVPAIMCIYDGFKIFRYIKNRDGLRIISFLITVLVLVIILHILAVDGMANPVPILLLFIVTNLFFVYNVILYIYNTYKNLSLVLLIIMWILCDSVPIIMIFLLSAGLSV